MNNTAQTTIQRLKSALARKGDLPSMSATLSKIVSSMKGSDENDEQLVQAVLSDVALTQKVLRLANSSMYSAFGGSITTVSKALFILGTETVGHLALGLKLIDNFGQAADSEMAQRELGMAVMSGIVARKLGADVPGANAEEVAVAALLRCTGRLLVCFYLPAEFKTLSSVDSSPDDEDAAARALLGLSYSEIAQFVAESWNLPEDLSMCMSDHETAPGDHFAWVQAVAGYARRYVSAVATGADSAALSELAVRYADAVGRTPDELLASAGEAFDSCEDTSAKLAVAPRVEKVQASVAEPSVSPERSTLQRLVTGYAEAQSMLGTMSPPKVTGMISEMLWDALGCHRVMFFLRRPAVKAYELMLGFGEGVSDKLHKVRFEEAFSPNAFHVALANGSHIYLGNTSDLNIARRVPQWLRTEFGVAKSILLVPVVVDKTAVGLMYLDWGSSGRDVALTTAELGYVERFRTLVEQSFTAGKPKVPTPIAKAALAV